MERFFLIISRLNKLLLLLILVGGGAIILWMILPFAHVRQRDEVPVVQTNAQSKAPISLHLERIENINGTSGQMMLLSTRADGSKFSSGSGYGGETRNVLILSGASKAARWLFGSHRNLVLSASQLREENSESKNSHSKALYLEYISTDSDGDGKLTPKDLSTVALAKLDGTGFVDVLRNVGQVISHEVVGNKQLSVVYQVQQSLRHATFSLDTLVMEHDEEIVKVPESI
jgi:hypothetical protein